MLARDEDAKGLWRHTQVISPHVVPQQPDLQRLRQSERETEAGTHMDLPNCGTTHDRNLNAAINLRNLIMPAGRGRSGRGREEELIRNRDPASRRGHRWLGYRSPAAESACLLDRDRAHCPVNGRAGNSGTTDDRSPNAGIMLIKPPAQRRMGVKRRLVDQGLWFNAGVIVVPARFSCCMTLHICDTGTAKFDR